MNLMSRAEEIVLLAVYKLVEIPLFENIKIIVMITAFTLINFLMMGLALFVIIKAATSVYYSGAAKGVRTINHHHSHSNSEPNAYQGVKYNWDYY